MGATDRVKIYLENKGITKYSFYKTTGFSNKFLDNSSNMGTDRAEIILRYYPDINPEWLLTGTGPMLRNEIAHVAEDVIHSIANDLELLYKHQSKAIERFWNEQEVPLYELDAAAGLSTIFNNNQQQNIINFIKIPDLPKCDGAIYARGDSMYPLIKSGDIVIFKEVTDLNYLQLGEMYLVDYTLNNDDYLVVKYMQKSEVKEHIKLVSHNPHHHPLDIPVSSIRAVAVIKASVRLNAIK